MCSLNGRIRLVKTPTAKKSSNKFLAANRRPTHNFEDVALILAGPNTPRWLPAHLEWWAQGIRYDNLVDDYRPSKLETVDRLSSIEKAVATLLGELENPSIRNLLDAAGYGRISLDFSQLKDLSRRAETARTSPELVGKNGKTKRGPGKPAVPDVFTPKALCAARIFEVWRFFNECDPGPGNLKAAEAAQAFWLAAGGTSNGYGDPLNGWYDHFRIVRDNEMSPGLKRLIWRRDINQSARKGDVKKNRLRTGEKLVGLCRKAWRVVHRLFPDAFDREVPNPWTGVTLTVRTKAQKPAVTRDEVYAFAYGCIEHGEVEVAAAAVICFEWLQRPENVIAGHIKWSGYRSNGKATIRIEHHKTGAVVDHPLEEDGVKFYEEAEDVLRYLPKLGIPLILHRRRGVARPFAQSTVQHIVQVMRKKLQLPAHFTLDASAMAA
jgi:hypothetical protein